DAAGRSLLDRDRADVVAVLLQATGEIPSEQFGPYRLIRPLGEGGAGVVYLARRDDLQADVAIKFLRDAWLSPARRERFTREQRMLAQLNHPSIARLYDAGTLENGTPWFVMEYVDGVPLDLFCERLPTTEARVRIFRGVCEAVAHAHAHGVVHRDLKPSNFLGKADGSIRLLDFGIASQISEAAVSPSRTRTGLRLLTPAYASPEQLRGETPTVSTDIYSLGVILYQLVTGQLPHDVTTLTSAEALSVIDAADLPAASTLARRREATPLERRAAAGLDLLCRTAMHADRQRRYVSVEALLADVDHWLQRDSLTARPDPRWHAAARWMRRRPAITAAAATIAAIAAVGAVYVGQRASAVPPVAAAPPITTRAVAVLPFQREGDDDRLDYLRFALPDEVATILSHVRYLSVLPSARTNRYAQPDVDVQRAGRELRVSTLVTGHFLRAGDMLHLTVEAIDVERNQSVWRDVLQVPANNLVATQAQLGFRVQGGLATAIGGTTSTRIKAPSDEEAYELFLKTAVISLDPANNAPAVPMLERSVQLDPNYPPVWVALARRYYVESRYGTGADTLERYNAALKTAVAIDPEYVAAASGLILGRVEDGDLQAAYAAAVDLTTRRPDSMEAHFALSYVLRFAGLVDEAAVECDTAFLLDPRAQTSGLRSCASVFM
ncbi:MAG: protein kinase domain-containing protein, partial [bacterium]